MADTTPTEHPGWSMMSKVLFGFILVVIAAVLGYMLSYWWVYKDVGGALDVSVLKNQVVARQKAADVSEQLKELGYSFAEENLTQLNNPSATNYHADVLGGYEPVKLEEPPADEDYYFYDEDGTPHFFTVDENNQIDPDSITPLIVH